MASTQFRFLGPEPVDVPLLGKRVEPDEAVTVDDDLIWSESNPEGYAWPEELWAEVGAGVRRSVPVADQAPPAEGLSPETAELQQSKTTTKKRS